LLCHLSADPPPLPSFPTRRSSDLIAPFIAELNRIRHAHPALQRLRGLRFHHSSNDSIVAYSRTSDDGSDIVLCVVNLDPEQWHEDRKSTRLNSSHVAISYAVFCLK